MPDQLPVTSANDFERPPLEPLEYDLPSLTPDEEDRLLQFVMARYREWQSARRPREDQWNAYYNFYRGILDSGVHKWRSKIFAPMTHTAVETILPRIMSALFGHDPNFDVLPIRPGDVDAAHAVKALIEQQLKRDRVYLKYGDYQKANLIYGTTIGKIRWRRDITQLRHRTPKKSYKFNVLGIKAGEKIEGWKEEVQEAITFDQPTFEPIDIFDIFIDPHATDFDDAEGVIHRFLRPLSWVVQLGKQGIYKNTHLLELNGGQQDDTTTPPQTASGGFETDQDRLIRQAATGNPVPTQRMRAEVEMFEFWGHYDLNQDGVDEPVVITVADQRVVVRAIGNPYFHGKYPFIKDVFEAIPNEFYGVGIPEILYGLQQQLNDVVNQRMDNVNLVLNRMWIISALAGVQLNTLVSRPGGAVVADDPNGVKPLVTPDVTSSAYREAADIQNWGAASAGATRFLVSQDIPSNIRTARGQSLATQESLERFTMIIRSMEERSWKPLIQHFYQLDLQFMEKEEVIRVIGQKGQAFQTVTPEAIMGEVDFIPMGALGLVNKDIKVQQLMTMYGLIKNEPGANRLEILRRIWEDGFGYKDANKFIPNLEAGGEVPLPTPQAPEAKGPEQTMLNQLVSQGATSPGSLSVPGVGA